MIGVVYTKKDNRVKIISEYGIIGGGNPLKSLYFQEHEWNIKHIPVNMLPSEFKMFWNEIVTDVFDESKYNLVSLKHAQKQMLGHDYAGITRYFCKNMCIKHRCACKVNNSICGSGCGCSGKCEHTKELVETAKSMLNLPNMK